MFKNIITIVSVAMSALLYGADVNLSIDVSNLNYLFVRNLIIYK